MPDRVRIFSPNTLFKASNCTPETAKERYQAFSNWVKDNRTELLLWEVETQASTTEHQAMIGTSSESSPTMIQSPAPAPSSQERLDSPSTVLTAQKTNDRNYLANLTHPEKVTSCPYCEAIKASKPTKLIELSAQDFNITHKQFTSRTSKQIIPPAECMQLLLTPFNQRVAAVSKSANVCSVCLATSGVKNGQCEVKHGIRRKPGNRQNVLCMQPGCEYNHLICQKHRDLNKGHPLLSRKTKDLHAKFPHLIDTEVAQEFVQLSKPMKVPVHEADLGISGPKNKNKIKAKSNTRNIAKSTAGDKAAITDKKRAKTSAQTPPSEALVHRNKSEDRVRHLFNTLSTTSPESEPFQVPEIQIPQNTHPSEKPVHRDKSEDTAESKTISEGKKVAEVRAESPVKVPIPTSVILNVPSIPEQVEPDLEEASVEIRSVVVNTINWEESVSGPIQDTVAEGPGKQSATGPEDTISAGTEEEDSQMAQSEQTLSLQPLYEELPAELLDTEQQEEKEVVQAFTGADLIEEESSEKVAAPEKEPTKSVETADELDESESKKEVEAAVSQNPEAKKSQAVKAAELEQDWDEESGDAELNQTVEMSKSTPKPTQARLCSSDNPNINADPFVTIVLLFMSILQMIPATTPQYEQPSSTGGPGTTIEKETQPFSVDESEVGSTTAKPNISSNLTKPEPVDKILPPSAQTLEKEKVHHASLPKTNNDKLVLEIQVPQNTHPPEPEEPDLESDEVLLFIKTWEGNWYFLASISSFFNSAISSSKKAFSRSFLKYSCL